jgi:hypothetical protein
MFAHLRSPAGRLFSLSKNLFGRFRDNVAGAWAVMRGRPEGLNRLDLSLEGFWRSFAVIVLIAPFAALGLLSQRRLLANDGGAASAPPEFALEAIALAVDWVIFPLVFALLARPLGLGARYVPFIVARNWAALIIAAVVSLVHAAHILGVLPSEFTSLVLLMAVGAALYFSYVIARTALAVPAGLALPIVALDLVISLTVWSAVDQLGTSGG